MIKHAEAGRAKLSETMVVAEIYNIGNICKAFSALTDRSFRVFINRSVASVLFLISMILIGASFAMVMIGGLILLDGGDFASGFIGLILCPPVGLLILILTRLFFESGVALVLIAENTKK